MNMAWGCAEVRLRAVESNNVIAGRFSTGIDRIRTTHMTTPDQWPYRSDHIPTITLITLGGSFSIPFSSFRIASAL